MNNNPKHIATIESQRNVLSRFQYLSWGEFSGTLSISSDSGRSWEFLFYQGRLVWSVNCSQPNRFWQRHISSQFPNQDNILRRLLKAIDIVQPSAYTLSCESCWQYQGLIALLKLGQIDNKKLANIIKSGTKEVLFDLLQANFRSKISFRSQSELFFERPELTVVIDDLLADAQVDWQEWHKQKLGSISPNKAPVIRQAVELYRQTTPIIYQNLVRAIGGNLTFREIATTIDQDLLLLTRSLVRYIKTGTIELIDLPDLEVPEVNSNPDKSQESPSSSSLSSMPSTLLPQGQLIVCIDDSAQICEQMKTIVTEAGYRFLAVQDATQALAKLLESKPDLIFLDLMMPQINGYEICTQIRRISGLSLIPIVILTGKDGLMERVRAKVTGASDFMSKPIERRKINAALDKYLGIVTSGNIS
jgi:chemotaxis family two-component system response regulator PixG